MTSIYSPLDRGLKRTGFYWLGSVSKQLPSARKSTKLQESTELLNYKLQNFKIKKKIQHYASYRSENEDEVLLGIGELMFGSHMLLVNEAQYIGMFKKATNS